MFREQYVTAVVSAAGRGTRMGEKKNKLLLKVGDKYILERTLEKVLESKYIDKVLVVIRREDEAFIRENIFSNLEEDRLLVAYGGQTREASTHNGLKALPEETVLVVTHDGARPFVDAELFDRCIESIVDVDGAVAAVPAKDTIKVVRADKTVQATPPRKNLYHVQTPQVFWKQILLDAYQKAMEEEVYVTDDASVVELFGGLVRIVEGDYSNIKITTQEDLLHAKLILEEEDANRNGL